LDHQLVVSIGEEGFGIEEAGKIGSVSSLSMIDPGFEGERKSKEASLEQVSRALDPFEELMSPLHAKERSEDSDTRSDET